MGIVKDVVDSLKDVAEGIDHIRTVATAVRDGRDYLKLRHPDVRNDLVALCTEMRNTATAIAAASAVLTHFRFTVEGSSVDSEPSRFNDHLIAHKEQAAQVAKSLQTMRGHCHVIRQHADRLEAKASSLNLRMVLQLFGIDSAERDRQVAAALRQIYDEEMQGYRLVHRMSQALQLALKDVTEALGPPGAMLPSNVTTAARLLGEYGEAFGRLESSSNYVALELQQSIGELE
jgi:hypothetical protein